VGADRGCGGGGSLRGEVWPLQHQYYCRHYHECRPSRDSIMDILGMSYSKSSIHYL